MTSYSHLVRDFARRTHKNLEFVELHKADPEIEIYEVTQLINSLLGLVVFPQQKYVDRIPPTPLAELEAQGWPSIKMAQGTSFTETLADFVRHLRNSIAHLHIKFLADDATQTVRGIRVWDEKKEPRMTKKGGTTGELSSHTKGYHLKEAPFAYSGVEEIPAVRTWEAELTLAELRTFTDKFIEMLESGEFDKKQD